MNLLLDTHVVLWWLDDSPNLPAPARKAIADTTNVCFVSTATLWEIEIKRALGKLSIPESYRDALARQGFRELPVSWTHTCALRSLPPIHRDPFDRMLVAQAISDDLVIVTRDEAIRRYEVRVL